MLSQLSEAHPDLIPIVWDTDSAWGGPRYSWYPGNGYVPWIIFGGDIEPTWNSYTAYENAYQTISAVESPLEMSIDMTIAGDQIEITTDIEVTDGITGGNNKLFVIVTKYIQDTNADYVYQVMDYDGEHDFTLTSVGETMTHNSTLNYDDSWEIEDIHAVAIVQSWSNPKHILQAVTTQFTDLMPMFGTNVTEGPANLGVQFTNNSIPQSGIDSWEWDFDGDGVFDSTEENPFHLYTEPGVYDVTLRIEVDGEFAEITVTDCITVTDGSSVSGNLSGVWVPDFNPYIISGDIEIAEENELQINEGVEIQFAEDVQFTVKGLLVADASDSRNEPIVFTSESSWNGIRFFNTQEENVLNNCEISNASVSAIKVEGDSKVDVIGCKIFDNNSTSLGVAFEIVGSNNVLISQNIIANNTSSACAGAIRCTASSVEITNNVIVNNTGQWGAFSFKNDSNPVITNNTIANNESTNNNSTTPYLMFLLSSTPIISNSILIDNGEIYYLTTPEITYSCVTGGFTGEGNIDEDPLFVTPTAGDGTGYDGLAANWSLQAGSPCINAGNPDAMYNDIDGTRNDMGAYGGPTPYELELTDSDDNTVNVVAVNSISVYPNPFNPTANIALLINENDLQQPVSVEIFNIKGQLVKTIVNNEIVQTTNFVWNGKDNNNNSTSSGMYFVKMKTATSEVSKKMLLIK